MKILSIVVKNNGGKLIRDGPSTYGYVRKSCTLGIPYLCTYVHKMALWTKVCK